MNVLSLFDGISCGRVALERAGVNVENYFASEIDKYAEKISEKNYPDIQRLGNVEKIAEFGFYNISGLSRDTKIDLIIAGSPCQGFSFAGKQLNFNDPRSKLFFKFIAILNELRSVNPDIKFMLENVRMKKECLDIITDTLGVKPVMINSSLLSAQNRVRYYWTNISKIEQPEDKKLLLKDILDEKWEGETRLMREKSKCIRVGGRSSPPCSKQEWDNVYQNRCYQVGEADLKGNDSIKRVYSEKGKSPTVTTCGGGHREPKVAIINRKRWRKLSPLECERLQTLPDNYTEGVSNTQRYKMIGNGWTVDVIAHIFKNLK